MKGFNFKKQALPHIIAIAAFLLIGFIYLSPVMEGKILPTHDIKMHSGAAKELKDDFEKTGDYALWTNSMFGGMPSYQIAPSYPKSLLISRPLYTLLVWGLPKPVNMLFLYFLSFYLMLLAFKVDWRLALAGAVAYGFMSYNIIIIDAGHNTKALAIGLAPLVIGAVRMVFYSKHWLLAGGLTGLALAFQLRINHIQITYYLAFILLAMGIAWAVEQYQNNNIKDAIRRTVVVLIAATLGILANAGNILMTAEYAKETTRGKANLTTQENKNGLDKDYITGWSYGISETGTFLIPNFHGGGSQSNMDYTDMELYRMAKSQMGNNTSKYMASVMYWGSQPGTNGPVYLGAVICFLFLFGFMVMDLKTRIWILSVSLLSIFLSWGSNLPWFSNLFIDYFPGYNKFRTVTMILAIVQITFPLLAILGLSKLFSGDLSKEKVFKSLKISLGVAGGLCLLFILMPGMFFDFIKDGEIAQYKDQPNILDLVVEGRESLFRGDAIRSLLFILAAGAGVWFFHTDKLKKNTAYIAFILLIAADMWPVASRYLSADKFVKPSQSQMVASKADRQIMQDDDLSYRVMNFSLSTFNDASTSFFHKSLGGYHGAKLRRIQEMIENRIEGEIRAINQAGFSDPSKSPVINMFNTKYFIASTKQGKVVVPNQGAAGNAWFVPDVDVYDNADAEMAALDGFNPMKIATTTSEFEPYLSDATYGKGTVELTEYKPDYLRYECESENGGFIVFSEVFYRGNTDWISSIDKEDTDHIRVNYMLRGMKVPAGKHTIEFRFAPPTYALGENLSMFSSILLVLLVGGGVFISIKKGKPTLEKNPSA